MNARFLRDEIRNGRWAATVGRPPAPPPEWKAWRRDRMRVSIRAAWLFLNHNKDIDSIRDVLKQDGLIKADCSRQRIAQYVKRGTDFFLDRGLFEPKRWAKD